MSNLTESRDQWQREWRLLNGALIKAEERIKELEAEDARLTKELKELEEERDGYRNGQDQLQDMLNTVMDSNAKLAAENKRLRAALQALKGEEATCWPNAELKQYLQEVHGISSTKEIPTGLYDQIVEWVDAHTGYTPKEAAA